MIYNAIHRSTRKMNQNITRINLTHINIDNLVCVRVIGDGSCMFHSILLATSTRYNNSNTSQRKLMASKLRSNLSKQLDRKYHYLSRGQLADFARATRNVTPFGSLEEMKSHLDSDSFVGQEYIELISDELNIDIYIIDLDKQDVYIVGDTELYIKNRPSVVIGYRESQSHYDMIGQIKSNNKIVSLFDPTHETIITLRKRIERKKKIGSGILVRQ